MTVDYIFNEDSNIKNWTSLVSSILNSTNGTQLAPGFDQVDNIIASIIILLVSVPGLFVYILFIIVAVKFDQFNKNPYFVLAAALGVADCVVPFMFVVYCVPSTIVGRSLGTTFINAFVGDLLIIPWYAAMPLICILAVNRYTCVCKTSWYKRNFTIKRTQRMAGVCWTFGLLYGIAPLFECCWLLYFPNDYSWGFDVPKLGATTISYLEMVVVGSVTVVAFTCNGLVFRKFTQLHNQVGDVTTHGEAVRRERERKLFIQFFITTIFLLLFAVPFNVAPLLSPSKWLYLGITVVYILCCVINGWVYFLLNESVRAHIFYLLGIGKEPTQQGMGQTGTNTLRSGATAGCGTDPPMINRAGNNMIIINRVIKGQSPNQLLDLASKGGSLPPLRRDSVLLVS